MSPLKDENPFEIEQIAKEWIHNVEAEKDEIRNSELYPRLKAWIQEISPQTILEIGCGQGACSSHLPLEGKTYLGVDPSKPLLERAKEKYGAPNVNFHIGNAYEPPAQDQSIDAAFSNCVWFHFLDLDRAALELKRILKPNGKFLIITTNPHNPKSWIDLFPNPKIEGKKVEGECVLPVNNLSHNVIYLHTLQELLSSFQKAGLQVDFQETFGLVPGTKDLKYLILFKGHKV